MVLFLCWLHCFVVVVLYLQNLQCYLCFLVIFASLTEFCFCSLFTNFWFSSLIDSLFINFFSHFFNLLSLLTHLTPLKPLTPLFKNRRYYSSYKVFDDRLTYLLTIALSKGAFAPKKYCMMIKTIP
jgi:hypothetical protein